MRVALGVGAALGLALCASPLLGIPGVESALILGLVLPFFSAVVAVRIVVDVRASGRAVEAGTLAAEVVLAALVIAAVPTLLLILDLLRVPACAPLEGLAFLALGPWIGVVLSALVGLCVGALVRRPRLATTLAALVPLALILLGLVRFWATPAVFAYAHFVGYFPGTLYDPDVTIAAPYLTFRVVSAAWALGALATFSLVWDRSPGALRARWPAALAATLALSAALIGEWVGPSLGHRSTSASIEEELGRRVTAARCTAIVPRELPRADARRLAEDCSVRVEHAERVLGVRQREPVVAFFFRNAEEKRRLMGASSTYIAKPWRDEVYLQIGEWPHPVLFHELVHVVSGAVAPGPFRVASSAFGLLPAPGIIEGVAVAIAWEVDDGLTPHQWAAAMLDADLAPPLADLMGLSFLLQPASRAYIASGSFLRWVLDTRGAAALRRIYLSGNVEEGLGRPLEEAERDWHRFLREDVPLPPEARALARLRFERPGIFGQICPHRIANLRTDLATDVGAGDDRAAIVTCREILSLDDGQAGTRAALAAALARRGDEAGAEAELARLIGPPAAAPPIVRAARLELADARWARGERDEARETYRALRAEPMSDDEARQLEVRLLAIEMGGVGERAVREVLVPRRDESSDAAVLMSEVGVLSTVRADGLGPYLDARQLAARQRFVLALRRVVEARRRGLPTPLLAREARRMEGMIRVGRGDLARARAIFREIHGEATATPGMRADSADWLARIRILERQR